MDCRPQALLNIPTSWSESKSRRRLVENFRRVGNVIAFTPSGQRVVPAPVGRPLIVKALLLEDAAIVLARAMTETAIQEMAKSGLTPMEIAIGLSWHLNNQVDIAMPSGDTAAMCKALLMIR
jgi:hypothetical protein